MTSPVVIVTGASRGIGLAVAEILLTKHKANVVSISRSRPVELETLGQKYPSALQIVQCDITNEAAISSAIVGAFERHGRLDALVLNAGTLTFGRIGSLATTVDVWKYVFDVNFFSLLPAVRSALPYLRATRGKVIFLSSGSAVGGTAAMGAYNTSKAAMNSFCRTLASEEIDITSIAIRPGTVDTDMQARIRAEGHTQMEMVDYARFVELHASGKLWSPTVSGGVIAGLALNATNNLSGKFLSWDADELLPYRN